MLYLNESHLRKAGINWQETIERIENAIGCLKAGDYAQPIKPYLRYRDLKNRIIAMPAFLGHPFESAGIKWIASFPDNIKQGIPRANCVVILNEAATGVPVCIINTGLISIIRTASVSGLLLAGFAKEKTGRQFEVGIIGCGPIGQYHFRMCKQVLQEKIDKVYIYDLRPEAMKNFAAMFPEDNIIPADSWEQVYAQADIFITCTVSNDRYIKGMPKKGGLYLNVSLRDFRMETFEYFKNAIIVDDWDEVCRENTDIEVMHKEKGLRQEDTKSIAQVTENNFFSSFPPEQPIMFNPMGMAIFDIAIAKYYYDKARQMGIGNVL